MVVNNMSFQRENMSRGMGKPVVFAYVKNKTHRGCAVVTQLVSKRLCFRYKDSTIPQFS